MFKIEPKTMAGATETTDGIIPHYRCNGFDCPVKLETDLRSGEYVIVYQVLGGRRVPEPMYRNGYLVFAMPGGKEVRPAVTLKFARSWADMD